MRALTVVPKQRGTARLENDFPEPTAGEGGVLVEGVALGVCGTDREIVDGDYGWAPPGEQRLVLGHESLGRVLRAPAGSGLSEGDWVVGIVRHPDPEPCAPCAAGEWDMCRNGRYTEHGIKALHGFAAERYVLEPGFTVKVDPGLGALGVLLEPASVLAKGWEHLERIGARATWRPRRVLVTGAGPIGLLGALMGVQRGLEVHVLDRHADGPKPELTRALGATYHTGSIAELGQGWDVVLECTGAGALFFDAVHAASAGGVVCLLGVSSVSRKVPVDAAALNKELVLENGAVFGSVNANRRHYEQGAEALRKAPRAWLERLITRRVPLTRWAEALEKQPNDVKVVLDLQS